MGPSRIAEQEHGVTLVELLVLLVLFSVAGAITMTAVVNGLRAGQRAEQEFAQLSDLKQSVERVARELRAADPLEPDPGYDFAQRVSANVYRGTQRRKYTYYVQDGELKQDLEIYPTRDADTPSSSTTGVLIRELDDPTRRVFRYQNDEPKWAAYDTDSDGFVDADCATVSDSISCKEAYAKSKLIEITLQEGPTEISTKVTVRRVAQPGGGS